MRPDQVEILNELSEKLADVFIMEADPSNWSGDGKLPVDMSRDERGDRAWCKKGALSTGGLLRSVLDLKESGFKNMINDPDAQEKRDAYLDGKIMEAERRAEEAVKRAVKNAQTGNITQR